MSPLASVGQQDFAVGILRGVAPDVQPGIGLHSAVNGLYNDDGDVYRRGGTNFYNSGAKNPLPFLFMWTGFLSSKPVVALGDSAGLKTLSPTRQILTVPGGRPFVGPVQPAITNDLLYLPNGTVWGGASKADYGVGTATFTVGNAAVVGVGTAWAASAEPGMLIEGNDGAVYVVKSVQDNTHLTLNRPWASAPGTSAYLLRSTTVWTAPPSLPTGTPHLAAIAERLVVGQGNRVAFSEASKPWSFIADDYHELPQGVIVMGLATIRDTLLTFTNYGLWSITNLSFNLTDAGGNVQQQLALIGPEISLWHESGLTEWAGQWVAPCIDRVFLIDGVSQPTVVSDSIAPLYMTHVRAGFRPGGAKVFRNTLILPIVNQAGVPQSVLTCRLNRAVKARYTYFPWSTFTGHAGKVTAADVSLIEQSGPRLLAAGSDGSVVGLSNIFDPAETNALDADGTAHEFDIETRDYPTGAGQPNHVRRLRLRYSLDPGDLPVDLQAGISYGAQAQTYETLEATSPDYQHVEDSYATYEEVFRGGLTSGMPPSEADPDRYWYEIGDTPLPAPGVDPKTWPLPLARRVRYIRARFRCTDAPARLVIHALDFAVRPATHDR